MVYLLPIPKVIPALGGFLEQVVDYKERTPVQQSSSHDPHYSAEGCMLKRGIGFYLDAVLDEVKAALQKQGHD